MPVSQPCLAHNLMKIKLDNRTKGHRTRNQKCVAWLASPPRRDETYSGILRARPSTLVPDPLWFKDAVLYEVHVRAFSDSGDDGMGDFVGLTHKLDYLRDLGVTAIWVLPFNPSPWRDDGY